MNYNILLFVLVVVIMASIALYDFWRQNYGDANPDNNICYYLLIYFGIGTSITLAFCLFEKNIMPFYDFFLPTFLRICLTIGLYDLILICCMRVLRKRFSACACAYLWVVPNVLYIIYSPILRDGASSLFAPLRIIYIPPKASIIVFIIWALGFILLLLKKIYENYIFQKEMLRDAYPFADEETLKMFLQLKSRFDKKNKIKLMVSPATRTPISVGIQQKNMKVILPEREYTEDEYRWIFRHELAHLRRNDCGLKLFLAVTNAIFWFLPMNWLSAKLMAEDQELSCDELIIAGQDEDSRREYARLVLNTAGDGSGFSSCLSSSKESLRYRLANVIHPRKQGGIKNFILIVVFTICVIFIYNTIEISAIGGNMNQVIFQGNQKLSDARDVIRIRPQENGDSENMYESIEMDLEAWEDYFQNTKIVKTEREYFSPDDVAFGEILFGETDDGLVGIESIRFYEDHVEVTDENLDTSNYIVEGESCKEIFEKGVCIP